VKNLRFILIFAGLLAVLPVRADFQAGLVALASRDFPAALKNFKPLAEKGNAAAQVNMGNFYMKGLGVEQDYAAAMRWYRGAADQGERMAQTKVGILYYYGLGVEKDPAEAARWFQKSAEKGEIRAQSILGSLYAEGDGVPKNLPQAYYWYTVAEEQGDTEAAKGRKSLENELTPGQRDEALRLMSETRKIRGEEDEAAFESATAGLGKPPEPHDSPAKEGAAKAGPPRPAPKQPKPAKSHL
jgi:TPR repeat protein